MEDMEHVSRVVLILIISILNPHAYTHAHVHSMLYINNYDYVHA